MQCWYVYLSMRHKKCLQTHHHVSPPTFGVDILLLLLYSNIYKGIRSFVLVPWMHRQCPVDSHIGLSFIDLKVIPLLLVIFQWGTCNSIYNGEIWFIIQVSNIMTNHPLDETYEIMLYCQSLHSFIKIKQFTKRIICMKCEYSVIEVQSSALLSHHLFTCI